jgi:ribosome biogenesis GTPase
VNPEEQSGLVVRSTGAWYTVQDALGRQHLCRMRGKFRTTSTLKATNPVAVGDHVRFLPETDADHPGVITHLEDRRNYMVRRSVNLSHQVQVIAANLDHALLVVTLVRPKTTSMFMDRFLATAEAYAIAPVLVFNKTDLYTPAEEALFTYYQAVYGQLGYPVLRTSATRGEGLAALQDLLHNRVSLISGHSGVGKSTLINALEPGLNLKTGAISEAHLQGQHTTTFAEMFPLEKGGYLIDTPGIRGFGLVHMEREEISHFFPDIFSLSAGCRFNNCLHLNEPGCAVRKAYEADELAPTRYENYVHLMEEDETQVYRYDETEEP